MKWKKTLTGGLAYSGCMDFILALFPWVILWKLQMKKREKFGILIAMSMGVLSVQHLHTFAPD
jgi:hypothetical protein